MRNEVMPEKLRELREKFGNKCWYCGKDGDNLQFAHLKPTELNGRGRGRKERYYDIIKNPDNYGLLHEDCHLMFDNGLISLSEIMDGKAVYIDACK